MLKRSPSLPLIVMLTIAFQLGIASRASAHHVVIMASATCADGAAVINYTASSWATGLEGTNPTVQIKFNGIVVDTGAFGPVTFSFSGTQPAPPGSSVIVEAVAAGTWGDGFAGGQSAAVTVTLPTDCVEDGTGRFTGGGNQVEVADAKVTRGLTIHCDLLLSNNLEVNWGGNHFHMLEHLSTVACTDSPDIDQNPPKAPLDTLIGIGTGRYNNVDGFTISFTLVDAGEPGTSDQMAIRIFETANPANVVLDIPLTFLTGGNLQAHFDQPHGDNGNK